MNPSTKAKETKNDSQSDVNAANIFITQKPLVDNSRKKRTNQQTSTRNGKRLHVPKHKTGR